MSGWCLSNMGVIVSRLQLCIRDVDRQSGKVKHDLICQKGDMTGIERRNETFP
jgi:hypothetical protein